MNPGIVGQEELEGSGRKCVSPRKRPVLWSADMGISMFCMAKGRKDFIFMGFLLGVMAVAKGGVCRCMITWGSPGTG